MFEPQHEMGRIEQPSSGVSLIQGFGYACIVIGIVVGVWVFFKVYGFLSNPASFKEFAQLLAEPLEITTNMPDKEAKIIFPFEPLGYVLVVLLFGITVKIAAMFLSAGAKLLDRDAPAYLKKLSKTQTKLAERIDDIRISLKAHEK